MTGLNNKKSILSAIKVAGLASMSALLMGNQSCQTANPANSRVMGRRVQIGSITAPQITLPTSVSNQAFDFQYVANQQMATVLSQTKFFSTANIHQSADYSPAGLDAMQTDDFNNCVASFDAPAVTLLPAEFSAHKINEIMSRSNSCVINLPQAVITGSINDFTLVGGGGINLSLAQIAAMPSLSFAFQKFTMQTELTARKPLDVGGNPLSKTANSNGYSFNLAATFNVSNLGLGVNGYYADPLSKVTMNGLKSVTSALNDAWNVNDAWYANVLKACGTYIYINGASDLGLKAGDIVAVRNVTYAWEGAVCDSNSLGDVPDATAVSYAQIISVGDSLSSAQIIKGNSLYPQQNDGIYAGARVYMHQTSEAVAALQAATNSSTGNGVCQLPVGTCTGK